MLQLWDKLKSQYPGWTVNLISDSSEGYCWESRKRLDVGLANSNPSRLLLHEVAHIGNSLHGNKHNQEWFDTYLRLLRKHLPGVSISESDEIIVKTYELRILCKVYIQTEKLR